MRNLGQTSKHIVAYIDLLGFKSKMNYSEENQRKVMHHLLALYEKTIAFSNKLNNELGSKMAIKIFSDNIIFTQELDENELYNVINYSCLLHCVSLFQSLSAEIPGWLIRGGKTVGELFINDIMVWGKALIRAYSLENNHAIYPRVLIDNEIVHGLLSNDKLKDFVLKDFDGMYFLNYLHNPELYSDELLKNGFELMKKEAKDKLNESIKQKLYWHMNYVNNELDRKKISRNEKNILEFDI